MSVESTVRAVTTYRLTEMKQRGEKIAMLTSYDYSMAKIVDAAGVDVILVGDSAANVMAGYETTVPITLDMMIYHARSVARAVRRALVVVDLPFGTYQGNSKVALESAVRIMKETEADAVKIEGGEEILKVFKSNSDNEKTLMVIGDSFRLRLEKYMPYRYQKTIFVRIDDFDQELLDKYEPDDVIVITVERDQRYMEKLDSYIIQDSGE